MSEPTLPTSDTLAGSVGVSLEATPPGLVDSESQCLFLGWGVGGGMAVGFILFPEKTHWALAEALVTPSITP